MRIGYVTSDWGRGEPPSPGGSAWARVLSPARALEDRGHKVAVGAGVAGMPDGRLAVLSHRGVPVMLDAEIVVCQRWMHEDAAGAIRAARAAGQVVVQDVDDWFWGLHEANRARRSTSAAADPHHNRRHYRRAIEASDAVTVSTDFLARRIRERFGTRTVVVRNAVDRPMFAPADVRPVTDGLVVGWVGALAWRSGDLETLIGVLDPWLERTGSTFVHHGTFDFDTDTAGDRLGVAPARRGPTLPARPPTEYPELLAGFDIGIVPLSDIPFNHAKSWIKGLEYAAAGIPFVARRTAEYEALGCGLLASTPGEWTEALDALRVPSVRAWQRGLGFEAARRHDLRARAGDWEKAYEGLLARLAPARGA